MAQSDGVINYNDTYTDGEYVEIYMPEEMISGTVNVLNDADFTFSIDKDSLLKNQYKDLVDKYEIHMDYVWLAKMEEDQRGMAVTKSPYEDEIDENYVIKKVGDNAYSLEGLDIQPDTVYILVVETSGSIIPTGSSGGGNGGGGVFSGYETSIFKVRSFADTENTDENSDSTDDDSDNSGHGSGSGSDSEISYYWRQDNVGWWVERSNGTYLIDEWYYYPTNGLWYYMGADGYMVTNTVTPDGYTVNADGVWIP